MVVEAAQPIAEPLAEIEVEVMPWTCLRGGGG